MTVRMGERYVDGAGSLTQAGYSALRGTETDVAALDVRVDALEAVAITSAPGDAPLYACRAWVNFNGTGTVAIRASGNVTSITDNGTGDYTVNFTTAMPDANYACIVTAGDTTAGATSAYVAWAAVLSAGSVRIGVSNNNTDLNIDAPNISVAVFR